MTSQNPLLEKLGYAPDARLVLFHADDVGMCHGANRAYLDLAAAGMLKAGSVMVPCPWSPEILHAGRDNPSLDLGVHITLTSEWEGYRWGPISTRDRATGLIDDEGWLYSRVAPLLPGMNTDAAVVEMRAQVERARTLGLDFTHIDAHMGAAVTPPLIQHYVELGFTYNVPVLIPRNVDEYTVDLGQARADETDWHAFTSAIEARGMPLVDTFRITPGYDMGTEGGRVELYEVVLRALPPGITYFSLHPNASGDIEAIVPDYAHWRTFEHEYFRSQRLRDLLAEEGITPIGYREIRAVMRGEPARR